MVGLEAGLRDRDLADAHVWACDVCPDAWAPHDPVTDEPIGTPAGPETRNARQVLRDRRLNPIIRQAGASPGAVKLATSRLVGFLADRLGLEREAAEIARLDLDQCRAAWKVLSGVDYDQVQTWAKVHRKTPPKPKPLDPPTMQERVTAAISARAIRAALADPSLMGEASTMHADMSRPRRALWITTWANLPGLSRVNGTYQHELLPGWQYAPAELLAEMIPDLEALAERGERPTQATSTGVDQQRGAA